MTRGDVSECPQVKSEVKSDPVPLKTKKSGDEECAAHAPSQSQAVPPVFGKALRAVKTSEISAVNIIHAAALSRPIRPLPANHLETMEFAYQLIE